MDYQHAKNEAEKAPQSLCLKFSRIWGNSATAQIKDSIIPKPKPAYFRGSSRQSPKY